MRPIENSWLRSISYEKFSAVIRYIVVSGKTPVEIFNEVKTLYGVGVTVLRV